MGPLWLVRAARWARRPPSKERVMIVLGVVALAALIIGGERLFGIELEDRDWNWRRGPQIEVAE